MFDAIGVGFGPAGIALAAAVDDAASEKRFGSPPSVLFLEEGRGVSWQDELLLPRTNIRHHFLRDFATPRNPRSRFTFTNYLKELGRLFSFGLLEGSPGRIEWADYCRWVAVQLEDRVRYGHRVLRIVPASAPGSGTLDCMSVTAVDVDRHTEHSYQARNIVLCTGRSPRIPEIFAPRIGAGVFHSSQYLSSMSAWPHEITASIAVIGAGQSAIEILLHLSERYPLAKLISIARGNGFRLHDIGHFTNEIYFPDAVDGYFILPSPAKRRVLQEAWHTNYSSVDAKTSHELYTRQYEASISGAPRITFLRHSEVVEIASAAQSLRLTIEQRGTVERQAHLVDAVILCTGYEHDTFPPALLSLRPYLLLDDDGNLQATRDYKLVTTEELRAGVFINGLSELVFGPSDAASFSMMAVRAERTLQQINQRSSQSTGDTVGVGIPGA